MADIDPFEVLSMQAGIIKADLDKMLIDKHISEDEYNKNISTLAYEYAINGFPDDCIFMLLSLKGDYFQGVAIKHFKEDDTFFSKCYLMFEVLSFVGHVPPDAFCNQAVGKA